MNNSKGQNVVEYVLLVTSVVLVCIYFFGNLSTSPLGSGLNAALNSTVNMIHSINSPIQF